VNLAGYWLLRLAALLDTAGAVDPTPTPTPDLAPGIDPNDVSPGLLGFLATFALVAMVIPLIISMNRHLRRARYRAEQEAALDAEAADEVPPEV